MYTFIAIEPFGQTHPLFNVSCINGIIIGPNDEAEDFISTNCGFDCSLTKEEAIKVISSLLFVYVIVQLIEPHPSGISKRTQSGTTR